MLQITTNLSQTEILDLCNLIWCLWKARNEAVFGGKKGDPISIIRQAQGMRINKGEMWGGGGDIDEKSVRKNDCGSGQFGVTGGWLTGSGGEMRNRYHPF